MSIQSEIDRLKGNVSSAYSAVQEMGGTVPEDANSDNLPVAIRTIQGGSASVQEWSNPNLLDNWYFAKPINQRGQMEYTGTGYTIDRWHKHYGTTLSTEDGFVRWLCNEPSYQVLIQVLENKELFGKMVTASALVRVNNKNSVKFGFGEQFYIPPEKENEWTLLINTGVIPPDVLMSISNGNPFVAFQFVSNAQPNDYIDLKAIKLELGSTQTLAFQDADSNWVLKDPPPNRALELTKCQRYYQVFSSGTNRPTEAVDYRPTMRVKPALGTIKINNTTYYTADANL